VKRSPSPAPHVTRATLLPFPDGRPAPSCLNARPSRGPLVLHSPHPAARDPLPSAISRYAAWPFFSCLSRLPVACHRPTLSPACGRCACVCVPPDRLGQLQTEGPVLAWPLRSRRTGLSSPTPVRARKTSRPPAMSFNAPVLLSVSPIPRLPPCPHPSTRLCKSSEKLCMPLSKIG
jgi:hypothetical protein